MSRPSRLVLYPSLPNVFLPLRLHNTEQILMKFTAHDEIIITNRLNGYILGEIGTRTREQHTRENSNRRQSVMQRC